MREGWLSSEWNPSTEEWEPTAHTTDIFVRCSTGVATSEALDNWVDWGTGVVGQEVVFVFDEGDGYGEGGVEEDWALSESGDAHFTPYPYLLLSQMLQAQRFGIGTNETASGISVITEFDMEGLRSAITSLSGWTCGLP